MPSGIKNNDNCNKILMEIQQVLAECNVIKYAAYRTSSKLRILQKRLFMDKVQLKVVDGMFERYQLQKVDNIMKLSSFDLEPLLADIYFMVQQNDGIDFKKESVCRTLIALLLNIFDREKKNEISVLSCKIFLAIICHAKPREKYHFLFQQLADHNNCLSKKKLHVLLNNLVDIIVFIKEENAFGRHLIMGTIESCFQNVKNSIGISEDSFMYWLMQDPQLLVWVSILYRMQISELVYHRVKCESCKNFPIIGLCYRCLRCMSYYMCQRCFFTGKLEKKHKLGHPIQEYCHPMSTQQSTMAFFLTLKNILCKKTSSCQYLPALQMDSSKSKSLTENTREANELLSPVAEFPLRELQSIIYNLQIENEKLIPQIEAVCENLEKSEVKKTNHTEQLKQCLLKHKIRIENEVRRLKTLKNYGFVSIKVETLPSKAPIASTPVVKEFLLEKRKRKRFNKGLENVSPIKVVDISDSGSKGDKKSEKRLLWDNYDFGYGVIKDSWEELRGDANDVCLITVTTESQKVSGECDSPIVIEKNPECRELNGPQEEAISAPFVLQDSGNLSHEGGYSWVLRKCENLCGTEQSRENSPNSSAGKSEEEKGFKELESDLRETLEKLRTLSSNLNFRHVEGERDGIGYEVGDADTLLVSLMNGIDKFIRE